MCIFNSFSFSSLWENRAIHHHINSGHSLCSYFEKSSFCTGLFCVTDTKSKEYTQSHICNAYCLFLSLNFQYHFPLFVFNEVKSQWKDRLINIGLMSPSDAMWPFSTHSIALIQKQSWSERRCLHHWVSTHVSDVGEMVIRFGII